MATQISKAVLITGCSTGIGRATAAHLAAKGWTVYATARKLDAIRDLEAKGCKTLALDVCDEASMRAAVETVEKAHGAVGVLVNNAGYGLEGAFEETPMELVRTQFETNVFGLIRMCQLALPGMRRQGWGKIVNLSSMGGRMALPGGAFYHATKFAVEALSDSMRFEVGGFGIDVVIIEPGAIKTEFGKTAIENVEKVKQSSSAYTTFNAQVSAKIKEAMEGPMAVMAGTPETVAGVIERAITARRPKTRYLITAAAHVIVGLREWLPDRGFDAFLRTQFTPPRA